jgi:hypothetical protein
MDNLLPLCFEYTENEGNRFFRNVGSVPVYPIKRRYIPEESSLYIHRFYNLKYHSIKENRKELGFKKVNRFYLVQERV